MTQTFLATKAEVMADPVGSIWLTPREYRAAVQGTPFDTERPARRHAYRTETEREILVEKNVRKTALFGTD